MAMLTLKSCLTVTIVTLALFPAVSQAAITNLADALNKTGTYTDLRNFTDISGEESIYIVGTMTFDAVDTTSAFDVVDIQVGGATSAYQWGHAFSSDEFGYFFPAPAAVLDSTLTAGESHTVVLKFSQSGASAGDYSLWLDPNLSLTEGNNTSEFDRTGGPTGTLEEIQFRGGNASSGVVDYTGFAIFTGDDTPFAVPTVSTIPEPSTCVLLAISVVGLSVRRRRRVCS